jgi:hypothetical protein
MYVYVISNISELLIGMGSGSSTVEWNVPIAPQDSMNNPWNSNYKRNLEVLGQKPAPLPLGPPQIPLPLLWD